MLYIYIYIYVYMWVIYLCISLLLFLLWPRGSRHPCRAPPRAGPESRRRRPGRAGAPGRRAAAVAARPRAAAGRPGPPAPGPPRASFAGGPAAPWPPCAAAADRLVGPRRWRGQALEPRQNHVVCRRRDSTRPCAGILRKRELLYRVPRALFRKGIILRGDVAGGLS